MRRAALWAAALAVALAAACGKLGPPLRAPEAEQQAAPPPGTPETPETPAPPATEGEAETAPEESP